MKIKKQITIWTLGLVGVLGFGLVGHGKIRFSTDSINDFKIELNLLGEQRADLSDTGLTGDISTYSALKARRDALLSKNNTLSAKANEIINSANSFASMQLRKDFMGISAIYYQDLANFWNAISNILTTNLDNQLTSTINSYTQTRISRGPEGFVDPTTGQMNLDKEGELTRLEKELRSKLDIFKGQLKFLYEVLAAGLLPSNPTLDKYAEVRDSFSSTFENYNEKQQEYLTFLDQVRQAQGGGNVALPQKQGFANPATGGQLIRSYTSQQSAFDAQQVWIQDILNRTMQIDTNSASIAPGARLELSAQKAKMINELYPSIIAKLNGLRRTDLDFTRRAPAGGITVNENNQHTANAVNYDNYKDGVYYPAFLKLYNDYQIALQAGNQGGFQNTANVDNVIGFYDEDYRPIYENQMQWFRGISFDAEGIVNPRVIYDLEGRLNNLMLGNRAAIQALDIIKQNQQGRGKYRSVRYDTQRGVFTYTGYDGKIHVANEPYFNAVANFYKVNQNYISAYNDFKNRYDRAERRARPTVTSNTWSWWGNQSSATSWKWRQNPDGSIDYFVNGRPATAAQYESASGERAPQARYYDPRTRRGGPDWRDADNRRNSSKGKWDQFFNFLRDLGDLGE